MHAVATIVVPATLSFFFNLFILLNAAQVGVGYTGISTSEVVFFLSYFI